MASETPDADALLERWFDGTLDLSQPDQFTIEDTTAKAIFRTSEGPVYFCFDLETAFRPTNDETTGLEQFDPYAELSEVNDGE